MGSSLLLIVVRGGNAAAQMDNLLQRFKACDVLRVDWAMFRFFLLWKLS